MNPKLKHINLELLSKEGSGILVGGFSLSIYINSKCGIIPGVNNQPPFCGNKNCKSCGDPTK